MTNFAVIGTSSPTAKQRDWVNSVLSELSKGAGLGVLHTGACKGIDQWAAEAWLTLGGNISLFLPWKRYEVNWITDIKRRYQGRGTISYGISFCSDTNIPLIEVAKQHHPMWNKLTEPVKKLHTRNAKIIKPCETVYATPGTKPWGGGTAMGIKIARHLKKKLVVLDELNRNWNSCGCS
jgi:hypothetical protein